MRPGPSDENWAEDVDGSGELSSLGDAYPELAHWLSDQPPVPMPDEVWGRIAAALAAEPPLRSTDPQVVSLAGRRSGRAAGRRRVMPLVGAAAGLALLGAVGIPVVLGGSASNPPVAEAPAVMSTPGTGEAPGDGSPGNLDPAASQNPGDVVVPAPGGDLPGPADPDPVSPTGQVTASPAYRLVATGTDYVPTAMPEQVSGLLVNAGLTRGSGAAMAEDVLATVGTAPAGLPAMVGSEGFTSDAAALSDCVQRLHAFRGHADLRAPALVVDRALFEGRESGVVVMLAGGQPGRPYLDVAVVGPECDPADVAASVWFRYDLP